MYNSINLSALSDMLDINLKCPPELFHMSLYENVTECGTTHCLVGNYVQYHNKKCSIPDLEEIGYGFGITPYEYSFLFLGNSRFKSKSAVDLSQKEALTRLAKFIIYKRRKKELWDDYEKARRTEGTNMFCDVIEDAKELVYV